jgi:hypothetical protein
MGEAISHLFVFIVLAALAVVVGIVIGLVWHSWASGTHPGQPRR